jgi:hypothetical protein
LSAKHRPATLSQRDLAEQQTSPQRLGASVGQSWTARASGAAAGGGAEAPEGAAGAGVASPQATASTRSGAHAEQRA